MGSQKEPEPCHAIAQSTKISSPSAVSAVIVIHSGEMLLPSAFKRSIIKRAPILTKFLVLTLIRKIIIIIIAKLQ